MYGQTGSGKTMTISHMQGRAAHHLFGGVTKDGRRIAAAAVEVTAIEVAGRNCRDLHSGTACTVLQTKAGGAQLKGAVPYVATTGAELASHLEAVLKSRRTEATAVNSTSSRSHALITLRVGVDGGPEGRLTLLDCAGSEWSQDSSEHGSKRRKEGAEINASLHALKQCGRRRRKRAQAKAMSPIEMQYSQDYCGTRSKPMALIAAWQWLGAYLLGQQTASTRPPHCAALWSSQARKRAQKNVPRPYSRFPG